MKTRKMYEMPKAVQLGAAAKLTLGDLTDKAADGTCCNKSSAEETLQA